MEIDGTYIEEVMFDTILYPKLWLGAPPCRMSHKNDLVSTELEITWNYFFHELR